MNEKRKELFEKLCKKTRELGKKVTPQEAFKDEKFPNPNEFAYYYGSFTAAADEAYRAVYPSKETPKIAVKKLIKVDHTECSDRPQI